MLHSCTLVACSASAMLKLLTICSPSAQNSTHFFSPPHLNSTFPPGPANFVHTNFRIFGQVMYSMEILFTVRPTCMHADHVLPEPCLALRAWVFMCSIMSWE